MSRGCRREAAAARFTAARARPQRVLRGENDPSSPREGGYRVPRCVADLVAARPVHLAVVDGIESMCRQENSGVAADHVQPRVLVAGTNPVCVDAVGVAVMGL